MTDFSSIPFDNIEKLGQRTLLYMDMFCVSWLLGRYCNYNCSYCWPYARSDTKDHRPFQLIKTTMDEIKRQARERNFNSFHFSFSGGEPTLHPNFLDILKHYSDDSENCNYQSTHMTSNISPGKRWFEKYIEYTKNLNRVSVTASWHREQGLKQGDLEKFKKTFADKLLFLQKNDIQVTINMVIVPQWFDLLYDEAKYFQDQEINVTLKPQSDPTASRVVDGYTDKQLKILHDDMAQQDFVSKHRTWKRYVPDVKQMRRKNGDSDIPGNLQVELQDSDGNKWYIDQAERFNAFNFNKFTGWKCNSGYQSIIIREPDGNIKRSYSCHDEPIGNIQTGFKLFDTPKECITPSCVSSADSKIPKCKVKKK